jgi:hypothetical protein
MIRSCQTLLFIGLAAAVALAGRQPSQIPGGEPIAIIDATRDASSELSRDLGRSFEEATPCSTRRSGATILEILGSDATAILVHRYAKPPWPDMAVVKEYLRRILAAVPEGARLSSGPYWAEGRRAEISGSTEFRSGQRRRIEFANGYAHIEDQSGCQWWGRYLGPDRSHWIVRE